MFGTPFPRTCFWKRPPKGDAVSKNVKKSFQFFICPVLYTLISQKIEKHAISKTLKNEKENKLNENSKRNLVFGNDNKREYAPRTLLEAAFMPFFLHFLFLVFCLEGKLICFGLLFRCLQLTCYEKTFQGSLLNTDQIKEKYNKIEKTKKSVINGL